MNAPNSFIQTEEIKEFGNPIVNVILPESEESKLLVQNQHEESDSSFDFNGSFQHLLVTDHEKESEIEENSEEEIKKHEIAEILEKDGKEVDNSSSKNSFGVLFLKKLQCKK